MGKSCVTGELSLYNLEWQVEELVWRKKYKMRAAIEQGLQPLAPSSGTAFVVTLHCVDASVCL